MEYIYIGKIVNTHGVKGELRLLSDFKYKDKVFVKDMPIYIGRKKEKEIINSYRHHKNFEMITLFGYNNINEVLKYKGLSAFALKSDLHLDSDEYLDEDLIGMDTYSENIFIGKILDIKDSGNGNKLLVIEKDQKQVYIPYHKEFIASIDFENKIINLNLVKGLI